MFTVVAPPAGPTCIKAASRDERWWNELGSKGKPVSSKRTNPGRSQNVTFSSTSNSSFTTTAKKRRRTRMRRWKNRRTCKTKQLSLNPWLRPGSNSPETYALATCNPCVHRGTSLLPQSSQLCPRRETFVWGFLQTSLACMTYLGFSFHILVLFYLWPKKVFCCFPDLRCFLCENLSEMFVFTLW